MLTSISWQTYFTTIIVLAAIYYTAVWWLFFKRRPDVRHEAYIFSPGTSASPAFKKSDHRDFLPREAFTGDMVHTKEMNLSPTAQLFLEELEALTAAIGEQTDSETLADHLKALRRKHASVESAELMDISAAINETCTRNCAINFDESTIREMWNS